MAHGLPAPCAAFTLLFTIAIQAIDAACPAGRWIYDYEELRKTALQAGIPAAAIRRSARMGHDLPGAFLQAMRDAEVEKTASRQAGRRENPTRCWMEQEVRERESLYVTIEKPRNLASGRR